MNVSTTIPQTVQIPRGRLLGLLAGVAATAAAITWALITLTGNTGSEQARSSATAYTPSLPIPSVAVTRASAPQHGHVRSIMDLTPGDLAGGGLGGYALPSRPSSETLEEVLASMSPRTRRYTKAVMSLTFAQLAAGAAGHP